MYFCSCHILFSFLRLFPSLYRKEVIYLFIKVKEKSTFISYFMKTGTSQFRNNNKNVLLKLFTDNTDKTNRTSPLKCRIPSQQSTAASYWKLVNVCQLKAREKHS
uniref:Secreted protein n=1 Tax=Ascaris lumbricoides TaxID=6252 RepID=A0A9J2PK84_ASCLU